MNVVDPVPNIMAGGSIESRKNIAGDIETGSELTGLTLPPMDWVSMSKHHWVQLCHSASTDFGDWQPFTILSVPTPIMFFGIGISPIIPDVSIGR